jgi:hypothetical protein
MRERAQRLIEPASAARPESRIGKHDHLARRSAQCQVPRCRATLLGAPQELDFTLLFELAQLVVSDVVRGRDDHDLVGEVSARREERCRGSARLVHVAGDMDDHGNSRSRCDVGKGACNPQPFASVPRLGAREEMNQAGSTRKTCKDGQCGPISTDQIVCKSHESPLALDVVAIARPRTSIVEHARANRLSFTHDRDGLGARSLDQHSQSLVPIDEKIAQRPQALQHDGRPDPGGLSSRRRAVFPQPVRERSPDDPLARALERVGEM